jgi:hypothetical protein
VSYCGAGPLPVQLLHSQRNYCLHADDEVEGCEHGQEKSLELQEVMTPVGCPVGVSERGPLGLGQEGEGLVVCAFSTSTMLLDASSAASGWLDSPGTQHLADAPCTL